MNRIIPYFLVVRGTNPRDTLRIRFNTEPNYAFDAIRDKVVAWIELYGYPQEVKIERLEK